MLDASVAGRWLIRGDRMAESIIRNRQIAAPSFITIEVANSLLKEVRAGKMGLERTIEAIHDLLEAGLSFTPIESLATAALALADDLGLSAYDASYVALAELFDVPVVTADRRLAAAYERAELLV